MTSYIEIPDVPSDRNLAPFFNGWRWNDDPESPVCIRAIRGTHIAPWVVTLFGAYGIWLQEVRKKTVYMEYEPKTYMGNFLERIGLPQLFGTTVSIESNNDSRIFPLTRIYESDQIAPISNSLLELLDIDDEDIEGAVKYSLVELLRNTIQHSRSAIGGIVSAVYFPKNGIVDICVADIGRGLKSTLRDTYSEINTDHKAVRFALMPHVSGTFRSGQYGSMKDNAGLGLFFIKEIASRSYGGFFLGSGKVLSDIWGKKDGSIGKKYIESKFEGWRGTFALLQLRKDTIGEFDSLLKICRKIAAETREGPTDLSIDFVDERLEIEGLTNIYVAEFEEDVKKAALIRDNVVIPNLNQGEMIVLDFKGVRAATQSFVHALMYRVFRDGKNLDSCLSVACADKATEEAIRAVAAYASVGGIEKN